MSQLAHKARLAVLWSAGFTFFRDLLQFGLMLVLVRMLPAEAYGQFGLTTTTLSFLTLYSFRPFLGHTLQVREEDRVNFQAHFTAGAVMQIGVFVVCNLLAVAVRWIPSYAPIAPLLHVMSVLFLLDLPCEIRVKMLERALDWRRQRGLHAIALVAAAVVSVTLAFLGWGVYALLLPLLVVPLPFIYDLFVRDGWRPTWEWNWAVYRPAWTFGSARVFAASFVNAAQLLESSWLSGALGFATLGIFGRALALSNLACQRTASLVSSAVYPVLTRIGAGTDAYRRASALLLRSVAWTAIPIAVLVGLHAADVVELLYGGRWSAVTPLLPWAMGAAAVSALIQPAYTLLLAHQRQDRCLVADIWRFGGTLVILLTGLPFGLEVYLAGLGLVHVVSLVMIVYWLHADAAVSAQGLVAAMVPPLVSAGLAAGSVQIVELLSPSPGAGAWQALFGALLFAPAYVLILRLLYRAELEELVGYFPQRRRLSRLLLLPEAA